MPTMSDFDDLTAQGDENDYEYFTLGIKRSKVMYEDYGLLNIGPLIKDGLLHVRRDP